MNKTLNNKLTFGQLVNKYVIIIAIIIVGVIATIYDKNFLTGSNLMNILRQMPSLGLVAIGMTVVIIGGYIDLSVAGLFSLAAAIVGPMVDLAGPLVALFTILALGLFAGFITSTIYRIFGVYKSSQALFLSYGLATAYNALALIITGGSVVHLSKDNFLYFFGSGKLLGFFPMSVFIFFVVLLIVHYIMKNTVFGVDIYTMGGNVTAARLSGVNVDRCRTVMYLLLGFVTVLGSLINCYRVTVGAPASGKDYETNAIMASVLGGTSLTGGIGQVLGTLFGVFLVMMLSNALIMIGFDDNVQFVCKGAILVAAIWLDGRKA